MRYLLLFIFSIFLFGYQTQAAKRLLRESNRVVFITDEGTLALAPLSDSAVRVQFFKVEDKTLPELVLENRNPVPGFHVNESGETINVRLKGLAVEVDKQSGSLSFFDVDGKLLLREKAGSRTLIPDSVMGELCYRVEQSFESPADEVLFGLGQFQDGHFNLKGITRRLTQVNSQIALPFICSGKGYGLLWHQYGLTDYNPADQFVALSKQEEPDESENWMEVTTTSGTQKVAQNQSLYTGKFHVPVDGVYSVFLDLGSMGNRHYVVIDGTPVLNQTNMWLPPTAGTLVDLKAGEHEVQLVCKSDNQPKLSWKAMENTTTFRSPHAKMLDYVVFAGLADEVVSSYRELSGHAPLFPKWAYGFWQCRERYTSGTHLVETVKEFRKRQLPVDVIVQDWQYWGSRGWGVPQFDEKNYPNPSGFIREIHDLDARFNISIWSNPDKNSEIGKQYVAHNRFIPNTKWLDYFNPETRQEYWSTLKENMFDYGVDSWWMDAVEPENDALHGERTYLGPGDFYRLAYPLMVSKAVYEGQRATSSAKRVCILTRSAFLGQQRYGIINWSGDISGNWDAYRRQIVAGLNYSLSGFPYWTTDIGGFFRPGRSQYTDEKYHELLTRWFQWGTFNPIFRMHGYMSETEPWKYGDKVEDALRKMLHLRYRLLPYIYSEAWQITHNGSTLMRPLMMDFHADAKAVDQAYEYMFGRAFLVAPIVEEGALKRSVYLPQSAGWYDFWTGRHFAGGQNLEADAPFDRIPLFVKAGSVVPMGPVVQHSGQDSNEELEIRIYEGADASFTLYEDEGDSYNYEKGAFSTIVFIWNDTEKALTIGERKGRFDGMKPDRKFTIYRVEDNTETKFDGERTKGKTVSYSGERIVIQWDY
ncbi:MAG TPA: glycoside hydrolase family 31 protein [Prolixibacteraceae bacterium]|nr:glycoside hydrolase family 31 protein [Prolixibacteraceae bacterium]